SFSASLPEAIPKEAMKSNRRDPWTTCSREDSNLHGLPHTVLSRTRLPIPPRERSSLLFPAGAICRRRSPRNQWVSFCRNPRSSTNAHRHEHVEKRALNLQHAGAHFVDEVEEDFVVRQIAQRRHEELGIEGD